MRTLAARLLAVVLMGTLAACGGGGHDRSDAAGRKGASAARGGQAPVILVGVDGLEWSVVTEMLAAGRLPVLADVIARGAYGKLRVSKPTLSPIIWTSIATGVVPQRHGIRGFVRPQPRVARPAPRAQTQARSDPVLYTSRDRRVKALWNATSDAGLRTWVVGWWLTFPVEPIDGVMVAQMNTVTPAMRRAGQGVWKGGVIPGVEGQVHPRALEPRVFAAVPAIEGQLDALVAQALGSTSVGGGEALGPVARRLVEQSRWAVRADALYHRIVLDLLASQEPPAFLAVYFGGPDVLGHRFWRYLRPRLYTHPPSEAEVEALGDFIPSYYAWVDRMIGEIAAAASDDATIIVVSDHGMEAVHRDATYRRDTLSGGHLGAPPALFAAAGPRIRDADAADPKTLRSDSLAEVGSVLDVAPTVLALLGLAVGADLDGKPMTALLEREFLEASPVREIARMTEPGWRPETAAAPASQAPGAAERIEQLRSLGYLE